MKHKRKRIDYKKLGWVDISEFTERAIYRMYRIIDQRDEKLKIAEDALISAIKSFDDATHTKALSTIFLKEALKQIRGEYDGR